MGNLEAEPFYLLYGLRVRSAIPLPAPQLVSSERAGIEFSEGSVALFWRVRRDAGIDATEEDWFQHARLPDGSDYLQWSGLFEFLVSADGGRIVYRELDGGSPESFQTYLLGQVLSFAVLKQGTEPLHATTVVIDGGAVAFLGGCGYGKSSLGAAFLQVGYPLLTDDLLVLKEQGDRFMAYPGAPRIKLFPDIARSLLGERVNGVPMNNETSKIVIPLDQNKTAFPGGAFPLKAIYVLTSPRSGSRSHRISIRSLSAQRAFVELIKNTFNAVIVESQRLERQFGLFTRLASWVPVRSLSYPRDLRRISQVRDSILRELAG
jgi:hypothetical protein